MGRIPALFHRLLAVCFQSGLSPACRKRVPSFGIPSSTEPDVGLLRNVSRRCFLEELERFGS